MLEVSCSREQVSRGDFARFVQFCKGTKKQEEDLG
jgi:hypothetical protein